MASDSRFLMSCRAYAKRRGVSPMAVTAAIKTGRLKASVGHDEYGQPKIADPDLADREWDANTDLTKAPAYVKDRATARAAGQETAVITRPAHETAGQRGETVESEGVGGATERLKSAQADLAELKFAEAAGELVPVADVRREWGDLLSQVRTKMLGLPTQIKQAIPTLSVAEVVLLEGLIRTALEDLSAEAAS